MQEKSVFTGSVSKFYAFEVASWTLSIVSAFLLLPYIIYRQEKWRISNSVVSGQKLGFDGKLWQVYSIFGVWLVITAIFGAISNLILYFLDLLFLHKISFWVLNGLVLLINSIFLNMQFRMWSKRHVVLDGQFGKSFVKSNPKQAIIQNTKAWAITIFSLKLASPSAHLIKMQRYAVTLHPSGRKLEFTGLKSQLYKMWWPDLAMSFATLGLYLPVLHYRNYCWRIEGLKLVLDKTSEA